MFLTVAYTTAVNNWPRLKGKQMKDIYGCIMKSSFLLLILMSRHSSLEFSRALAGLVDKGVEVYEIKGDHKYVTSSTCNEGDRHVIHKARKVNAKSLKRGDRHVIHKARTENAERLTCCSGRCLKTSVHIAQIEAVAKNSLIQKNNYLDGKKRPYRSQRIVSNAMSKLGDESYNVFCNNCEHFATWCRYGVPHSMQVSYWCNLCILIVAFPCIIMCIIFLYSNVFV